MKIKCQNILIVKLFLQVLLKIIFFYLERKKDIKKTDSILFISQVKATSESDITPKYKIKIDNEIRIVKALENYCKRNNYLFKIAAKSTEEKMDFYKRKFGDGEWTIIPRKEEHTPAFPTPYDLVNNSSLVVFTNSTLGLEALVKGIRGVAFPPEEFPCEYHEKKFSCQVSIN